MMFHEEAGMAFMDEQRAFRTVFVGDLSFFCTEIDIGPVFAKIGNIVSLEVKRGRHGDSLMHGFVEYDTETSAQNAIVQLNGHKFMGRCMRVNWTNMKASSAKDIENWVQVHVNFLTPVLSKKVTEEFIESVFIQYGQIGDITVKRHLCSHHPAQVTGYGFVYFLDAYAALRAVHGLKGVNIDGVIFECCLSYKAEQLLRDQIGGDAVLGAGAPASQTGSFFKRQERSPHQYPVQAPSYRPRPGQAGHGYQPPSPSQMERNLNVQSQFPPAHHQGYNHSHHHAPTYNGQRSAHESMSRYPYLQQEQQYGSHYPAPSPRSAHSYHQQQSAAQFSGHNESRYFAPPLHQQQYSQPPKNLAGGFPRRMAASAALSMNVPRNSSTTFMYEETFMSTSVATDKSPTSRLESYAGAKEFNLNGIVAGASNNNMIGGGTTSSRSSQSSDNMNNWLQMNAVDQGLSPLTMQRDDLSSFSNAFGTSPAVSHSNGLLFDMSLLTDCSQPHQQALPAGYPLGSPRLMFGDFNVIEK